MLEHQQRIMADLMMMQMAHKRRRARIRREIELASQQARDAVVGSYALLDRIDKVLKGEWSALRRSPEADALDTCERLHRSIRKPLQNLT